MNNVGGNNKVYPLKMRPVYKDYLWGGENLHKIYGKGPEFIAESWEASDNAAGKSVIDNGILKGKTIGEAAEILGSDLLGAEKEFPMLFKLIDAHDRLSIQVHPDDEYAFRHENGSNGKTEFWYVLHAEPGAKLICGFKEDTPKCKLEEAIKNGTVEDLLNSVEVSAGDVFYIPAGTIHGIGKGIIVAEIQECSDVTYRVYDYNRRDKNGNTRPLHIDKALEVVNLKSLAGLERVVCREHRDGSNNVREIISSKYFNVCTIDIKKKMKAETDGNCRIVFCISGEGTINGESFKAGDTYLLPAEIGKYKIKGNCKVIVAGKGDNFYAPIPEVIKSKTKQFSRFTVRDDILKGEKGEYPYSFVRIKSGVTVLPVYEGKIVTIRQYRHAFRNFLYELPAGVIDEGETPEETAIRELYEETGFKAEKAEYLGPFYPSPGATDEVIHLFSAECTERDQQHLEKSELINVCIMEEAEFAEKIAKNKILHGGALAAYLKYRLKNN
ncbi:MAG: NUDIX domain-containing protein [Clostridia bacterium]|nr:NUDIX domain-containing protein [Clostridia bacterium]